MGDGTRFVRLFCDLHPDDQVCFVSCGGCSLSNEVASGLVGYGNKSMAILPSGVGNDITCYYPDRDFSDLGLILKGEKKKIDIIKANDSYAVNILNFGFDTYVSMEEERLHAQGKKHSVYKAFFLAILKFHRQKITITIDGEPVRRKRHLFCTVANCKSYCGGKVMCSPLSVNDDGFMDIILFHPVLLPNFLFKLKKYKNGTFINDPSCRKMFTHYKARTMTLQSKDLIYVCLDGEVETFTRYNIELLPGAVELIIPALEENRKQ
jgi:Sphingosine kinase and enzymes related to eukaryotic diacylglycerol kinase